MNRTRRFLALAVGSLLALPLFGQVPMKIVVPFAAGGGGDLIARMLGPRLSQELGRPVLVENRVGASGQLGMQYVKAAPADGSVVVLASDQASIIVPLTADSAVYDTTLDFIGLGRVAQFPYALAVAPGLGVDSLPSLLVYFKDHPADANVGLPSKGGIPEMVATALGRSAGVGVTPVPYGGAAPVIAPLLGGQLTAAAIGFNNVFPLHKDGKVKVVAVTGTSRSKLGAEIPTFAEQGIGGLGLVSNWTFYAPARTPRAFADRFNSALNKILAEREMVQKINAIYMDVAPSSVEQSRTDLNTATADWRTILKAQGTLKR